MRQRPVAVRRPRGVLHIAVPRGRAFEAACGRLVAGADTIVYESRDADKAWQLELVCQHCDRLAAQGRRALVRFAGW